MAFMFDQNWSKIKGKLSNFVSVSDTFEKYWYCICIGTDTFCEKVSVSAHRYILNVSTKGLVKPSLLSLEKAN